MRDDLLPTGTALIEFGFRDSNHSEGSGTDCEYNLALALQKSVGLLKEMLESFGGSENEVVGQTEKFLLDYKTPTEGK